jgi:hypothetical protein
VTFGKFNFILLLALTFLFALPENAFAASSAEMAPSWFTHDIQRKASWLPSDIKRLGVNVAYQNRWDVFPDDIRTILNDMQIPHWLIALVPMDLSRQEEIFKQFRFMVDLAGSPPVGKLAQRVEQLLIFGGAAQLPTPGDAKSGVSLGPEGCTAAMSRYVLSQLAIEYPNEFERTSKQLLYSQSSSKMKTLFAREARAGANWFSIVDLPFSQLRAADVLPGSLMIAQKPGGTHVFGWTRVPRGWGWANGDKMAIGNTGLPQFGSRMILAQEYITDDPNVLGETEHNTHGPINSHNVVYSKGQPNLSDNRTNVYSAQGSDFILIRLN